MVRSSRHARGSAKAKADPVLAGCALNQFLIAEVDFVSLAGRALESRGSYDSDMLVSSVLMIPTVVGHGWTGMDSYDLTRSSIVCNKNLGHRNAPLNFEDIDLCRSAHPLAHF